MCGKCGHKPGDCNFPEYKKENERDKMTEKNDKRKKKMMEYVITAAEKGI